VGAMEPSKLKLLFVQILEKSSLAIIHDLRWKKLVSRCQTKEQIIGTFSLIDHRTFQTPA